MRFLSGCMLKLCELFYFAIHSMLKITFEWWASGVNMTIKRKHPETHRVAFFGRNVFLFTMENGLFKPGRASALVG